eukprot:scaffold55011_cov79-Cyclotella_meneghiniana.AAC.3
MKARVWIPSTVKRVVSKARRSARRSCFGRVAPLPASEKNYDTSKKNSQPSKKKILDVSTLALHRDEGFQPPTLLRTNDCIGA